MPVGFVWKIAAFSALLLPYTGASAQHLPSLLVRLASNWKVESPDGGGTWKIKGSGGTLCNLDPGDRIRYETLSTYGSQQILEDMDMRMTLASGSEAILCARDASSVEWELTRGTLDCEVEVDPAYRVFARRNRTIKVRGIRTSGQAGGRIVPASFTGTIARYLVTMYPDRTTFQCLEGAMIVDGQKFEKGQSTTVNYP